MRPGYQAQVVLPHPKRKEEDVVVFLDAKFADGSTGNELEQRAAVAALQRVAGDRNYHMLLPKQYLGLWQSLGAAATAAAESSAARAAAAAQREARTKVRAKAAARRAPAPLILSREKQALIQEVLQQRAAEAAAAAVAVARSGRAADATSAGAALLAGVRAELEAAGFSVAQVQAGVKGVVAACVTAEREVPVPGPEGSAEVLHWLLAHLPTSQIPPRFTQGGHLARPVTRLEASVCPNVDQVVDANTTTTNGGGDGGGGAAVSVRARAEQLRAGLTGMAAEQMERVLQLTAYGYPPDACESALLKAGGSIRHAHQLLYARLLGTAPVTTAVALLPASAFHAESEGEMAEELLVLQSIFGDDALTVEPDQAHIQIRQPLPDGCAAAVAAAAAESGDDHITLHAWCALHL